MLEFLQNDLFLYQTVTLYVYTKNRITYLFYETWDINKKNCFKSFDKKILPNSEFKIV